MSETISSEADTPQAAGTTDAARNRRRTLQGMVIGTAMDKTITVRIERVQRHPKYGKYVRKHKKYLAHDEQGQAGTGDTVTIMSTRPLSKRKRWRLVSVDRLAENSGEVEAGDQS